MVVEALETVLSSNPIKKKRTMWGTVPRKQLAIRNQALFKCSQYRLFFKKINYTIDFDRLLRSSQYL
jgi:hypothetical protein